MNWLRRTFATVTLFALTPGMAAAQTCGASATKIMNKANAGLLAQVGASCGQLRDQCFERAHRLKGELETHPRSRQCDRLKQFGSDPNRLQDLCGEYFAKVVDYESLYTKCSQINYEVGRLHRVIFADVPAPPETPDVPATDQEIEHYFSRFKCGDAWFKALHNTGARWEDVRSYVAGYNREIKKGDRVQLKKDADLAAGTGRFADFCRKYYPLPETL